MGFNFTKKNLHQKCLLNSANFFRKGKLQKKKEGRDVNRNGKSGGYQSTKMIQRNFHYKPLDNHTSETDIIGVYTSKCSHSL